MAYTTEMYFLLFQRLEVQDQDVTELISLEASLLALHVAAFSLLSVHLIGTGSGGNVCRLSLSSGLGMVCIWYLISTFLGT